MNSKKQRRVGAGTVILDYKNKKVLIVQSYHGKWGLPKGEKNYNETLEECAIRETFEETGIRLLQSDLKEKKTVYYGEGNYFFVDGTGLDYKQIENYKFNEEITGIMWISTNDIVKNKIQINSHLRTLICFIDNFLTINNKT